MLKKSEVKRTIALGVIAAHTSRLQALIFGPTQLNGASPVADAMADALLAIDCGYSCTSEDLEGEIALLSADDNFPKECRAAMKARQLFKEIEPLSPNEQKQKLEELALKKLAALEAKAAAERM